MLLAQESNSIKGQLKDQADLFDKQLKFMQERLTKLLESLVEKGEAMKLMQETIQKTEENIIQMKRKNAGGDVR